MTRLPTSQNRTTIVGTTGSGKTQFAVWLLSTRDLDRRPWIILDYKGDGLINDLKPIDIRPTDAVPKKPGIYRMKLIPEIDDAALEGFFYRVLHGGYVGLYTDEGFMLPRKSKAFLALVTQGRSKHIEMITLVQRPRFLPSVFILTESQFFAFMYLTNMEDRKHLQKFADGYDANKRLPQYWASWYDVDRQEATDLSPVPDRQVLIDTIARKTGRKVHAI